MFLRRYVHASDLLFLGTSACLLLALLLGGGTRPGFLGDVVLQAFACVVLVSALAHLDWSSAASSTRIALLFCLAVAILPLLQLLPVRGLLVSSPKSVDAAESVLRLAGLSPTWKSLTVSPRATWLAFLSLLPPFAIFAGCCLMTVRQRRRLSLAVLVIGGASAMMGLLQVAQGPDSPLRFYSVTNPADAVGLFANRNHFAALMYSGLVLAGVWAIGASNTFMSASAASRLNSDKLMPLVASLLLIVVFVGAGLFARSRAGLGLTIVALAALMILAISRTPGVETPSSFRWMLGAAVAGILLSIQFALYRILERFDIDPLNDARIQFGRNTAKAAWDHMPFGSGVGTFRHVYGLYEPLQDALVDTYANRAHNDVLEVWLETGVLGAALGAIFLIWLVIVGLRLWRRSAGLGGADLALARGGLLIVALLLMHSVLDYPLRTSALSGLFAFACALLLPAPSSGEAVAGSDERIDRRPARTSRMEMPAHHPIGPTETVPQVAWGKPREAPRPRSGHTGERWGSEVDWPDDWKHPDDSHSTDPDSSDPEGGKGRQ